MCVAALGIISTLAGGAISMMGQSQQAATQAASLRSQALFNDRQAVAESYVGGYDAYKLGRKTNTIIGGQEAGFAKAGIEGVTPTEAAVNTVSESDMDKQAILFGSDLKSSNYSYKATMDRTNASQVEASVGPMMLGTLFGMGTKLSGAFT